MKTIQFLKQHILLSFIIISGITLLCSLGFWQLSRAHYKENLANQLQNNTHDRLLRSDNLSSLVPKALRYRRIALTGFFMNEFIILLDNKLNKGQPGYHVIVPFQETHSEHIFLVDRGWIPLGKSRDILPSLDPVNGEVTIEGYLDFAYRNPFIKDAIETNAVKWPLRMQNLEIPLLQQLTGKNYYSMLVKLDKDSLYGFETQTKNDLTSTKHKAYAFQWFSLALALFILTLFAIKRNTT